MEDKRIFDRLTARALICFFFVATALTCLRPGIRAFLGGMMPWETARWLSLALAAAMAFAGLPLVNRALTSACLRLERRDTQGRVTGYDVTRLLAASMVISLHALYPAMYYSTEMDNGWMLAATFLQGLFICCVPLFMTLSGALLKRRRFNSDHVRKTFSLMIPYVLCCAVYWAVQAVRGEPWSLGGFLIWTLRYDGAWYVPMYLGLCLMAPALNLVWSALAPKGREFPIRQVLLILVLLCLVSLPTVTQNLFPVYWIQMYPLAYYFIGCFLADYRLRVPRRWMAAVAAGIGALYTFYVRFSVEDGLYSDKIFGGLMTPSYLSMLTFAMTAVLFVLLQDVSVRAGWVRRLLRKTSSISLEFYLLSIFLADPLTAWLMEQTGVDIHVANGHFFLRLIPYVLIELSICMAAGCVIDWMSRALKRAFRVVFQKTATPEARGELLEAERKRLMARKREFSFRSFDL